MRNTQLLFRLLAVLLCFLTACEDKENAPKPPSRKDMLTSKTWKMKKVLMDGINITDDPAATDFKNMRIKFKADGTYTITTPGDNVTGTWAFADNERKLIFDPNTAGEDVWDIVELKDSSVKTTSSKLIPAIGKMVLLSFEFIND